MLDVYRVYIRPLPEVEPTYADHSSLYAAQRHLNALKAQIGRGWEAWIRRIPAGTDIEKEVRIP